MRNGELVGANPSLDEIRDRTLTNLNRLPDSLRQLIVKEPYEVRFSAGITRLREEIEARHSSQR